MAQFTINSLTLGEVAKVEELSGLSITAVSDVASAKGRLLAALAFAVQKRATPAFTWNDALGLTIDEANAILGLNEADETEDESDPE